MASSIRMKFKKAACTGSFFYELQSCKVVVELNSWKTPPELYNQLTL